jgi:hypothetical protein
MQALADFRFLPYRDDKPADAGFREEVRTDKPHDVNSEVAYLSENFVAEPFSDDTLWLPQGLHLHWALPDALTVGRHPPGANGEPDPSRPIEFPSIPNRWLVIRTGGNLKTKRWVVESDYLWSPRAQPALPMLPVTYPLRYPVDGEPPFRYLGRVRELTTDGYQEDPDADFLFKHNETLTALGYGEPNFHAFYPDCHSVLGLFDDEVTTTPLPGDLEYQVYGWYSYRADNPVRLSDPLRKLFDDFNAGQPAGSTSRDAFIRRVLNTPEKEALTAEDYRNALVKQVKREFGWQIAATELPASDANNRILIKGMVCGASLKGSGVAPAAAPNGNVKVAVGNSGIEALTAFLADDLQRKFPTEFPDKSQVEAQLEALVLSPQLHDQTIDLGPKFEEASHNSTFTPVPGGTLWKLRPDVEDRTQSVAPAQAAADPQTKPLPEPLSGPAAVQLAAVVKRIDQTLAGLLADVNQLQGAYDRGQRVIRSLRRDIFSGWYTYMVCCHRPPDTHESDYPDADEVKWLIEKQVVMLYLTQVFVGQLKTDTTKTPVQATVIALDPKKFHMAQIPAAAIKGVGQDLWNQLPAPDAPVDARPEDKGFLADFATWCPEFVAGNNLHITPAMLDLLGKGVYDTTGPAFWERYPQADTGRRQFESVAQKLAGKLNKLAQCATQLNKVHAHASQANPDTQAILNSLRNLPEPIQPTIGSLLEDAMILESQQKVLANQVAASIPAWLLQPAAAPRFWQPNDPVLLLAGPSMKSSDRHGEDGDLPCLPVDLDPRTADASVLQQLSARLAAWKAHDSSPRLPFAARLCDGKPYHPLFLEWEVGVLPLERHGNVAASARRFHRHFIRNNFQLNETRREFLRRDEAATPTGSTSVFVGRSILVSHARDVLKAGINRYFASIAHDNLVDNKDKPAGLDEEGNQTLAEDKTETYEKYYHEHARDIMNWCKIRCDTMMAKAAGNGGQIQAADHPVACHAVVGADDILADPNNPLHLQSQALSGFNAALLMHRQTLQLPVADPLAFPDYRSFSEQIVCDAVGDQNHVAPEPLFDFQPIRSGNLNLVHLRLVDTFGQVHSLQTNGVIPSARMLGKAQEPVSLPPRITQPARVHFRWLSAMSNHQETNSQASTSPVCGWVVANRLDNSLMIYDAGGAPLGYVDVSGRWRTPPGRSGPILPADIPDPHLARMVRWICDSARTLKEEAALGDRDEAATQFLKDLVRVIDTSLQNIEPQSFRQHEARALLMSRPLALVRAAVDLQLSGPPVTHRAWEPLRRRLLGQPTRTDQFLDVEFPVRIGEHMQLNDGVIGYWLERGERYLSHYTFTAEILKQIVNVEPVRALTQQHRDLPATLELLVNQSWFGAEVFLEELQTTLGEQGIVLSDTQFAQLRPLLLDATRQGEFLAPQSNSPDARDQKRNFATSRQGGPALNFQQSLAAPPQMVSILMDPRGSVHCTTGVLPTKALSIPSEHFTPALKNLNITFLSAPLLTGPGRVNLPLPGEPGFGWSWLQQDGAQWTEITTTPMVPRQAILDAFADGQWVWDALIQQGWLAPVPGHPDRATFLTKDKHQDLPWDEVKVQRVLDVSQQVLGQALEEARFGPTQEIREGWLQIKPQEAFPSTK